MGRACSTYGRIQKSYGMLVGRPEGKRPLGRPRRRWEDNIKMDLREVGYDGRDWINLAQDRDHWWAYVRVTMNLRVPEKPFVSLIVLVVSLVMWFPFPLDQVTEFWKIRQGSRSGGFIVPCTELVVEDVWTKTLSKLTVETAVRLNDVNGDGVLDVIVGYGTGADGHNVPDFVCTLYFDGITPCLGGVIALDGLTGRTIWQHWTPHPVFLVDCSADLTEDKTNDCLISGKGGHSYFEVNELRKSVEFISSKFDSLREEMAHTRHELNSTQEEMKRLVQENDHLKQEVSDLQQYTRRDNIMLFGVSEIDEQSTYEVIDQISEVISGSELVQHDVSVAHSIPSRPGKTRPIVISFTKSRSRDEWLQLFRNEAKNDGSGPGIATKKVNRDLPAGRITAGDQLTAVTRDLLNKTRVARKDEASPVLQLVNGHDGSRIWQFAEQAEDGDFHAELSVDVFAAQFVQDVDGDGFPDVLSGHTQDAPSGLLGNLLLVNGRTGKFLQKVTTPHGEETYYAPQVLVHMDGVSIVVFGTGGQASPGGVYALPLHHLIKGNMKQICFSRREKMEAEGSGWTGMDQDPKGGQG
ncbi:hypothetical protein ANN_18712 [Periplaneta americana]|uniref:Uncharacterized protein n=1 Tax=Periplaneta americana TaxID=6978 RepID=A0ABQ8SQT6_PERAM|nr:hypothetical protein ANN_18712 [Periplaneta americana]